MRVLIAAGGTAGHVFPGLAVAARLRDRHGADVTFVGRAGGQEASLVPGAGFPLATVEATPFERRLSLSTLRAPFIALRASRRVRGMLRGVDVAVGMGGYASVALSLAARGARVPLVLHEQNAVPGLANRLGSRWAHVVALSFGEARARLPRRARTVVTGNPIRDAVLEVRDHRASLAADAAEAFGLANDRRTVVIFGGSQGALHLNRAIVDAVRFLADRDDLQLLVLTGRAHHEAVARRVPTTPGLLVRTRPYVERMELVYAMADLIVSRSGAGTIAEVTACGLPALLVPYPYATARHQEANARALVRAGGAGMLLDDQLSGRLLAERIESMLDPARLRAMRQMSERFGRPDAADVLADVIVGAS